MPTKTPSKKRTTSKSSVAKRPAAKKVVTKRKAPTKKKGLRRLLEIRKKGSATRKGIFIGAGVVVVAAIAFTGYALWQGNGANAGGAGTLGRSDTTLGTLTYVEPHGEVFGTVVACKYTGPRGIYVSMSYIVSRTTGVIVPSGLFALNAIVGKYNGAGPYTKGIVGYGSSLVASGSISASSSIITQVTARGGGFTVSANGNEVISKVSKIVSCAGA